MPTISRLVIDQQFAQVGIKITPAQMQITTPHQQMKIDNEIPQMEIETEKPTFEINMDKVRNESGLKDPLTLMREIRNSADVKVYNYISQTVQDGNQVANVEQKGNRIAEVFKQKSLEDSSKEINFGSMPQSLPEIVWNKGSININWSHHNFNIEWTGEYTPEVVVDPRCSVEVYLRNRPSITITVEEAEDPVSMTSRHIDAKL